MMISSKHILIKMNSSVISTKIKDHIKWKLWSQVFGSYKGTSDDDEKVIIYGSYWLQGDIMYIFSLAIQNHQKKRKNPWILKDVNKYGKPLIMDLQTTCEFQGSVMWISEFFLGGNQYCFPPSTR